MIIFVSVTIPSLAKIPFMKQVMGYAFYTVQIRNWFFETAKEMINARRKDKVSGDRLK